MIEKITLLYDYLKCSWNGLMRFLSFNVDICPNDKCQCKK
jgi:hypothetical protein